jgi:hypothetical protein
MQTITKVTTSTTMLIVYLSDNSFRSFVYANPTAAFLYAATPKQRDNWDIQDQGRAVVWPELGKSLLVEQLG